MSHPKWTALQCSIVPIALSVALGGRQNRTVTRATNDFLLQNWNIYRTYRCICWCQCFFNVPSAAVAWLPATSGPAAIGPAWSLLRWSRKYMCVSLLKKKKILLWAQLWLQPLWTFLKRVDRNTFVLCQQCLPSYQLASSLPATKPVNWSVLHPVCASFKSILCILKLIFQVKWNKDRKPR